MQKNHELCKLKTNLELTETKKVDKLDCGDLVKDRVVDRSEMLFLHIFGRPYSLGHCEPIGLICS